MGARRLADRLRHPKTTVRWRLTLLYGGLFLVCGAALLAITYTLVDHATVSNTPFRFAIGGGCQPRGPRRRTSSTSRSELRPVRRRGTSPEADPEAAQHAVGAPRDPQRGLGSAHFRSAPARDRVEHRARDHGDHLRRARLGRGGARAGAVADDDRRHPADFRGQPPRAARDGGPTRRAEATRRHDRRVARAPRGRVRCPTTVRRQRLARAAHAADRGPSPARDGAQRPEGNGRDVPHDLPAGARGERAAGAADRRPARAGPGTARGRQS